MPSINSNGNSTQHVAAPTSDNQTNGNGRTKRECPISREHFGGNALPLTVQVDGKTVEVDTKEFSTGSFGWYYSGKVVIEVGGVRVPVQVGMTFTIIGSKDAE